MEVRALRDDEVALFKTLRRRAGFVETGARDVLPANEALATVQMALALY
jgi:hypothetical protein